MDSKQQTIPGAGKLGMRLLLLSLSVLFLATMTGYILVRTRAEVWPPPGMPKLPSGLWISTAIIVGSGIAVEFAFRSARAGRQRALRREVVLTLLFGVGFLVSQTINWAQLVAMNFTAKSTLYGFTFYLLTGLHAAHVIGGLVPLVIVARHAFAGRYSPDAYAGVEYCRSYWHFLGGVWIVMYGLLLLAS